MSIEHVLNQQEFWITQWHLRNSSSTAFTGYSSAATWNVMAAQYGTQQQRETGSDYLETTCSRLHASGFRFEGSRILDVGCGPGFFAREFARRGAEVIAIDISDKMINRLQDECLPKERHHIVPVVADWQTLDCAEFGFAHTFDLVFANMTPAVTTPESLMKLIQASRGRCWFRGWTGPRTNPLLEQLYRIVQDMPAQPFHGNFVIAWNLVCSAGYFPDCSFEPIEWTQKKTLEECIALYTTFFTSTNAPATSETERNIITFLSQIAVDGYIENCISGHTGSMLWSV